MGTFAPEVSHYFLPSSFPPIRGAAALARHWRWWKQNLDPVWAHDHLIARGHEVVLESSVVFTAPGTGKRLMNRGTEWYVLRSALILEVRAYFIPAADANAELATFPYLERGYRPASPGVLAAGAHAWRAYDEAHCGEAKDDGLPATRVSVFRSEDEFRQDDSRPDRDTGDEQPTAWRSRRQHARHLGQGP